MSSVLLTGFGPFGKYNENSSWAVAEKVTACGVVDAEVIAWQSGTLQREGLLSKSNCSW